MTLFSAYLLILVSPLLAFACDDHGLARHYRRHQTGLALGRVGRSGTRTTVWRANIKPLLPTLRGRTHFPTALLRTRTFRRIQRQTFWAYRRAGQYGCILLLHSRQHSARDAFPERPTTTFSPAPLVLLYFPYAPSSPTAAMDNWTHSRTVWNGATLYDFRRDVGGTT